MDTTNTGKTHLRREVLANGVINAVFNGVLAWLLLRSGPDLLWGTEHSFALDIMATSFLLPLIVALIVIPLQRSKLRKGALQPINIGDTSFIQGIADRLPSSAWKSALLFGLFGMAVIAPLTLLGFHVLGVESTSPAQYAIFKGVWSGIVAGMLVAPMVLIALRASA